MRIPRVSQSLLLAPSAARHGERAAPAAAPLTSRVREPAVRSAGLPGHIVADFALGDTGQAHCPSCERTTRFVVRQVVFSLPAAGFTVLGRGGVCVDCNTLTALRQVSFDAIAAAWASRPAGADQPVFLVHRTGESEAAYQLRLAASLDAVDQLTAETLTEFAPPLRDPRVDDPPPAALPGDVPRAPRELFGWLPATEQ